MGVIGDPIIVTGYGKLDLNMPPFTCCYSSTKVLNVVDCLNTIKLKEVSELN